MEDDNYSSIMEAKQTKYTITKAYRPITLMETLAKLLSGCISEFLSY